MVVSDQGSQAQKQFIKDPLIFNVHCIATDLTSNELEHCKSVCTFQILEALLAPHQLELIL